MKPFFDASDAAEGLAASRRRTLDLVEHVSATDLERVLSEPMSPLVWDLAHIASYEDLWLNHQHGGLPLLHPELAAMYDAFETPREVRADLPILDEAGARGYLAEVRERSLGVLEKAGPGDGGLVELVVCHEFQHTETMRQAMRLGGILPAGEPPYEGPWESFDGSPEWLEIGEGSFVQGASDVGFAYDNERPAHEVQLPAFRIASRPINNLEWRDFVEQGGYEQEEIWSPEGIEWKQQNRISDHTDSLTGHPAAPVGCICWFEADAYSKFAACRLPTESEWERAAAAGLLALTGEVWEWTSSGFEPYPGFSVYPYPEYSQVFFGGDFRVLRGGSWATDPMIKSPTFRNWDLPLRRQLFAGLRLADDPRDAE